MTIKKDRNRPKIFIAAQLLMYIYFSGSHTVVEITISYPTCVHAQRGIYKAIGCWYENRQILSV